MKKAKSVIFGLTALAAVAALASCGGDKPKPTASQTQKVVQYDSDDTKHRVVIDAAAGEYDVWEAHVWGDWVVTKEATLTEKGSRHHTCTVCGKDVAEEIPMVKPESGVTTEVTAVYAIVPSDWENANVYYWGDDVDEKFAVGWPGIAMTLVDETTHLYGFKVPAGVANVIFNNGSVQTVDIAYAPSANLYKLAEKDGDKYTVEYSTYTPKATDPELATKEENAVVQPLKLYVKVEYELTAESHVYMHTWGDIGHAEWPGKEMTKVENTTNVFEVEVPGKSNGFIVNLGNGQLQSKNLTVAEGQNAFIVKAATIMDGENERLDVAGATYAEGEFTELEVVQLKIEAVYLRGVVGGEEEWGAVDARKLTVAADQLSATVTIALNADDSFKVADATWGAINLGYSNTLPEAFADAGGNIKVVTAGTYVITVTITNNEPVLTITAAVA